VKALAKLKIAHHELMTAIAENLLTNQHRVTQATLYGTLWSFATLNVYHRHLFDAVCDQTYQRTSKADCIAPYQLTQLMWSLAALRHHHPQLVSVYPQLLSRTRQGSTPQWNEYELSHLVTLVWSLSRLHYSSSEVYVPIARELINSIDELSGRQLFDVLDGYVNARVTVAWAAELFKRATLEATRLNSDERKRLNQLHATFNGLRAEALAVEQKTREAAKIASATATTTTSTATSATATTTVTTVADTPSIVNKPTIPTTAVTPIINAATATTLSTNSRSVPIVNTGGYRVVILPKKASTITMDTTITAR
jgi:hypothetical protein